MRRFNPHTASSVKVIPLAKAALTGSAVAVLAAALAACTTSQYAPREGYDPGPTREMPRPNFPIAPPGPLSTAPAEAPTVTAPPAAAPESDVPAARPAGTVSSQPLPPPIAARELPPAQSSNVPPLPNTPTPAPTPATPAYVAPAPIRSVAPPPPVTTTTTVTSVSGRVVDISSGPETYTIRNGDTLTSISKRMGMTQKELADLNDLEPPYALRAGRTLKGPATKAKAYVVGQGDTLFAIARRFTVTAAALAETNDLRTTSSIRAGQRLELPKGYKDTGPVRRTVTTTVPGTAAPTQIAEAAPPAARPYTPPPSTTVTTTPATPSAPASTSITTTVPATPARPATTTTTTTTVAPPRPGAAPVTTTTTTTRPTTPPPAVATSLPVDGPALSDSEIAAAGRGRFAWPVRGSVISSYGPTGAGGQRNDGLNVRASAGDVVRSAAAGEVVYAGDQVPGFGNLVLVKHDGGWVTAYAHLARADVKMRQQVAQGQQIGQVGTTGGVEEPQLHFEVRYAPSAKDKARPIDPSLVLPR